jgi:tetratricopeptide (TPR) repeat protein
VRYILVIGVVALCCLPAGDVAAAQSPDSLFSRGCDLYEAGEFSAALSAFQAAAHGTDENAALYYNLGNTQYRMGSNGRAIADYRRALMLSPRDEDIRANLEFVRTMVGTRDTLAALGVDSPADIPLKWLSPREVQAVFYVSYYILALAFLGILYLRGRSRRWSAYALAVFAVVAILSYGLSAHALSRFRNSSGAVVVGEEIDLRSGPGNAFERIATLRDGVEVKVKSRSAMWVEIELPTGEVGWLRDSDMEEI